MVLNYIWIAFFVIAFIFALIGLAMGDTTIKEAIAKTPALKAAFDELLTLSPFTGKMYCIFF